MSEHPSQRESVLVAVWPGMGDVALSAGYYLMSKLAMRQFAEVSVEGLFDVAHDNVVNGIVRLPQRPRNRLFRHAHNDAAQGLIVSIGEAQPPHGKFQLCEHLLEVARKQGVDRVFTFAAMATDMQLGTNGRVFAAATETESLTECLAAGCEKMDDGQTSGLTGWEPLRNTRIASSTFSHPITEQIM